MGAPLIKNEPGEQEAFIAWIIFIRNGSL